MKILIFGDLHGIEPDINFKEFDVIITPGDICSTHARNFKFKAAKLMFDDPKLDIKWFDICGRKEAERLIKEALINGRKILEKLNSFGVPVYIVPGNNDYTLNETSSWNFLKQNHWQELIQGLENIHDVHHKILNIGGYQIIGYGIISEQEYPQYQKYLENISKEKLENMKKDYLKQKAIVSSLFKKSTKPVIFLSHNVPYNTDLDEIKLSGSPSYGEHMGSIIVREMIEEFTPLVSIGVHIHEIFGQSKLNGVTILNSGYGKVSTLMTLEDHKIKELKFYPEPYGL